MLHNIQKLKRNSPPPPILNLNLKSQTSGIGAFNPDIFRLG